MPLQVSIPDPPVLSFQVSPNSMPPTNVHVLIGRNGVGKTTTLARVTNQLLKSEDDDIDKLDDIHGSWTFAGLLSISFSAFDDIELIPEDRTRISFGYIGLKSAEQSGSGRPLHKTVDDLADEFVVSAAVCREGIKRERWRETLQMLETDPLFQEVRVFSRLERADEINWKPIAREIFGNLSAGHKIVLLTVTRLVELVDERTLVLIDEPEAHLHPPLLSALVRTLSQLLISRNGVAIIATHSPVVLQEVPKACVWVLNRSGSICTAHRPEIETFGENVGVLTREIFGLEVTKSGFHKMVEDAVDEVGWIGYPEVLSAFNGQLGAEARSIARSLLKNK